MRIFPLLAFLLLLVLAGCKCTYRQTGLSKAQYESEGLAAIERFHAAYNAGEFQRIYLNADAKLREKQTEVEFCRFLGTTRASLGQAGTLRSESIWRLTLPFGTWITMDVRTQFERARVVETFEFRFDGVKLNLASYQLAAPTPEAATPR